MPHLPQQYIFIYFYIGHRDVFSVRQKLKLYQISASIYVTKLEIIAPTLYIYICYKAGKHCTHIVYIYIHTYIHTHTHTHIYIYIYIYIYGSIEVFHLPGPH